MAVLTFADLRTPKTIAENKTRLYNDLVSIGVTGVWSWESGSVPSSLVEIQARALTDYQEAQKFVAEGGLNSVAVGDALTQHAFEVYGNRREQGRFTIARLLLTDSANVGPFTFSAESTSFSVGKGGLLYHGFGGSKTLPRGGSIYLDVISDAAGVEYAQIAVGAIDFFARGVLPGVSVTNDASWLNGTNAVQGTSDETDERLRMRNAAQWGTLPALMQAGGTGPQGATAAGVPAKGYTKWALDADPQVTRVAVYSNLDILDPGRVDVVIAGVAGGVGAGVVLNVQNAIAPAQIGGSRIPETARCVVTSAVNRTINLSGIVYVQREYNTPEFQAQIAADVAAYSAAFEIGGFVSWERLLQVVQHRAGLSPGVIINVDNFLPNADQQLGIFDVPQFSVAGLSFVSL